MPVIANAVKQFEGLTPYRNQIHTINYHELEFSEHQNIAQTLWVNIYFTHPYSS